MGVPEIMECAGLPTEPRIAGLQTRPQKLVRRMGPLVAADSDLQVSHDFIGISACKKGRVKEQMDTASRHFVVGARFRITVDRSDRIQRGGLMRRGFRLLLVLILVVAAAGVGWVAGSQIKSPAQVAAEAEPPEPSVISVPVQLTVISNDIITRGTARFEDPQPVLASEVVLAGVDPVITMMPEVGDTLKEGEVLYELAGRPTFILRGDLPLFRSAQHKDVGEDIAQLQEALTRLGFFD